MSDDRTAPGLGGPVDPSRRRIEVPPSAEGERLDRFLASRMPGVSRERIARLVRDGTILLAEERVKPSARLAAGLLVSLPDPLEPAPPVRLQPEPVPLQILFEDDDLLVIHKPQGMVVHPGAGVVSGTLVHGLLHHLPGWKGVGGGDRPGIVHRLDRGTSGLIVVAKSQRGYADLVRQVQGRTVTRRYIALVWGAPSGVRGTVSSPIGRDPRRRQRMAVVKKGGKEAATDYELLRTFDTLSLLRLSLRTGRTHQIRVHMSSVGHPVFADATYGGGRTYATRLAPRERSLALGWLKELGRPALHAYHLAFDHPGDGERLQFEAPVPEDMERLLEQLEAQERGSGGMK